MFFSAIGRPNRMDRHCWVILTGEYPPQPGGVGDYTQQLAQALVRAGDEVHVWSSPCNQVAASGDGVIVHRLADHFGPRGLFALSAGLKSLNRPYRLLVQYTPHAYGYKAMNLLFCRWLARRKISPWVHFHEVAYPFEAGQRWRHLFLALMTHWMAKITARAASRIFVTTSAWCPLLERFKPSAPMTWMGACSNLSVVAQAPHVEQIRRQFGLQHTIVGHFGTFGQSITPMLAAILPPILSRQVDCSALLVGRGGEPFAQRLMADHPTLQGRVTATGAVPAQHAADCLAACDVLVQPFPDGITARRSSLMAGLALGRAIVTSAGPLTEPFWRDQGAVIVARSNEEIVCHALKLLSSLTERQALGMRAAQAYRQSFAIERAADTLRAAAEESAAS